MLHAETLRLYWGRRMARGDGVVVESGHQEELLAKDKNLLQPV